MSRYDIAIVGMGCVVPDADNVKQYWENIKSGDTYFSEMPKSLWNLDNFHSADKGVSNKTYTKVGSFVKDFKFPALDYKMPPANLRGIDPAQLMTVVATKEALEDAASEISALKAKLGEIDTLASELDSARGRSAELERKLADALANGPTAEAGGNKLDAATQLAAVLTGQLGAANDRITSLEAQIANLG